MRNTLSESQASVLRSIFGAAPDAAVINLESALAAEVARGGPMAQVHGMLAQEAVGRRVRSQVFMPVVPLCRPGDGPGLRFPPQVLATLWAALRGAQPDAARAAEQLKPSEEEEDPAFAHDVYDTLCRLAAEGLRAGEGCFTTACQLLDQSPDGVEQFAKHLDLAPLARRALARLPEWMGRLSDERAVAIRIAYNDAEDLSDDAGPRLLDMLCAHMSEPWRVLHLISAIMDRPGDRFAAASEIARFGEYFLDEIDRRLAAFRHFDLDAGRAGGVAAANDLQIAAHIIAEFETSLDIHREGPWGGRIAKQKQSLAQLAETRLAQIDKAIDAALPLQQVKFGKGLRGFPRLNEDPQALPLARAESLLAFFEQSRACANQSGYGSARTKAGERLDGRLEQYVQDLLELLRAEEVENEARVRLFLEAAADLTEVARGEKAAAIIRRRAAA